jgi:hypothetical protein
MPPDVSSGCCKPKSKKTNLECAKIGPKRGDPERILFRTCVICSSTTSTQIFWTTSVLLSPKTSLRTRLSPLQLVHILSLNDLLLSTTTGQRRTPLPSTGSARTTRLTTQIQQQHEGLSRLIPHAPSPTHSEHASIGNRRRSKAEFGDLHLHALLRHSLYDWMGVVWQADSESTNPWMGRVLPRLQVPQEGKLPPVVRVAAR